PVGRSELRHLLHRLPAVARPADAQRADRRRYAAGSPPMRVLRAGGVEPAASDRRTGAAALQSRSRYRRRGADDVRPAQSPDRSGRRRRSLLSRRPGVRRHDPAQCAPVRSAEPWLARADLRSWLRRQPRLYGAGARADRPYPARAEEGCGMSDDPVIRISAANPNAPASASKRKPALGRGLGALLGESRREEPLVTSGDGTEAARPASGGLAMLAVV